MIDKIERLRESRRLSQEALEGMAGLKRKRLAKLNGGGELRASEALRTARVLGVPVDWLCDDDAPGDVPPDPAEPLKTWEQDVIELIRVAGLTREDVLKRLMLGPMAKDVPDLDHPEIAAMRRRLADRANGGTSDGKGEAG